MDLNGTRENENKTPAACLLIANQQGYDSTNQFPRKLPTETASEMSEPDPIFQNSTVSVECEPRMLDMNGPDVIQNDSGIELESQIIQDDNVNNHGDVFNGKTNEEANNGDTETLRFHMVQVVSENSTGEIMNHNQQTYNADTDDKLNDNSQRSGPDHLEFSKSLTLQSSSADDEARNGSSSALTLEEVTRMARKMSRPTMHKNDHVREEDFHIEQSHPPQLVKQSTREFQTRYRPISESPRYGSENKAPSPRSPRNKGMASAFSMDEIKPIRIKTTNTANYSGQEIASNLTAIESQIITNDQMTDEQRALNDITAMTRKATRPTVKDLDLSSPTKVRSKSVAQIKSPLASALSPHHDRTSVFHYPEHPHEKSRSKSLAHVSLSPNPALSPLRSPGSDRFPLSRSSSTSSSSDYSPIASIQDPCFRCWKTVYPLDKVGPIRKVLFHKLCFKCFECGTSLTLKNYCQNPDDKMDKAVYCKTHQPVLESSHVTLEDRNINITMNYPKLDTGYNSNIRGPYDDRRNSGNIRPLSIRGTESVPKLDVVCGDSLNDSWNSGTSLGTPRGTLRILDTNGNEFEDKIIETRSRQTAVINSPRHLSLADDIKLTPLWSRSARNAAHIDIGSSNRNAHHFYSYGSDMWNNL